MRRSQFVLVFVLIFSILPASLSAQQSTQTVQVPTRDQQAVTVLGQALAAMGNMLPADSVATGTITIVEGARTQEGTIRIATRGQDQSVEHITTPNEERVVVYSHLAATETRGGKTKASSLELAASSQTPD